MPPPAQKPDTDLTDELLEVADAAEAFLEALRQIDDLPEAFPIGPLNALVEELKLLEHGTAEGCAPPLDAARLLLLKIRHSFFVPAPVAAKGDDQNNARRLERNGPADKALQALFTAVDTAYTQQMRQAGASPLYEDEAAIEIGAAMQATLSRNAAASRTLSIEIDAAADVLSDYGATDSETAQLLVRSERSLARISGTAAAVAEMKAVLPRLLGRLGAEIGKAAEQVESLVRSVVPSRDIDEDHQDWWRDSAKGISATARLGHALGLTFQACSRQLLGTSEVASDVISTFPPLAGPGPNWRGELRLFAVTGAIATAIALLSGWALGLL